MGTEVGDSTVGFMNQTTKYKDTQKNKIIIKYKRQPVLLVVPNLVVWLSAWHDIQDVNGAI